MSVLGFPLLFLSVGFLFLKGLVSLRRVKISKARAEQALRLRSALQEKYSVVVSKPNFGISTLLRGFSLKVDLAGILALVGQSHSVEAAISLSGPRESIGESIFCSPGSSLFWKGYVVCGSTSCGDNYFFDVKTRDEDGWPQIVLLSHEENYLWVSRRRIESIAKVIAVDYLEFVEQFLEGSVDDFCLYFDDED